MQKQKTPEQQIKELRKKSLPKRSKIEAVSEFIANIIVLLLIALFWAIPLFFLSKWLLPYNFSYFEMFGITISILIIKHM